MTGVALERPRSSVAWELRTSWATGRRVALRLSAPSALVRVEGHVTAVAPSGVYVKVGEVHVPVDVILAVYWPSRLGDSSYGEVGSFNGPARAPRRDARQLEMIV